MRRGIQRQEAAPRGRYRVSVQNVARLGLPEETGVGSAETSCVASMRRRSPRMTPGLPTLPKQRGSGVGGFGRFLLFTTKGEQQWETDRR